ncbi:MAG: discoidin domain-containing protein [Mariprofundaceae bacterium]
MRKRMIEELIEKDKDTDMQWLDLEKVAQVEMTSEQENYPIEAALVLDSDSFWQASIHGEQTIRLLFDEAQEIRCIHLLFEDKDEQRTQEFVLRWSSDKGQTYHDIARQQYNFSSPDSTCELENYNVELMGVTTLELMITPDSSGGNAHASLKQWSIA